MASEQQQQNKNKENLKPGSSPQDAAAVGGKDDFGAHESDTIKRNYVSANTKQSDPGHANPRAGEENREVGAGASAGGAGSASGGDLDATITGAGTGTGLSQSGPDNFPKGSPDESDGTSRTFASGPPAQNKKAPPQKLGPGTGRAGSTIVDPTGDVSTGQDAQGADAITNPQARHDDSFSAEISSGEAGGQDDSPSDRQG